MSKKLKSSCNDALQTNQNPLENIENLILNIRGKQVMLDRDLARLYGVETKVLNQAVKRNIERFPERFMFQLTDTELIKLVTICDRFNSLKHSSSFPYAFTEYGVTMLASVLKSDIAVQISIKIVDAFVAMRHALPNYNQLFTRIENIEHHQLLLMERQDKTENHIESIFKAHDRFLIIDDKVYHVGASIKDLGKKLCAISLLSCINADEMINRIQ